MLDVQTRKCNLSQHIFYLWFQCPELNEANRIFYSKDQMIIKKKKNEDQSRDRSLIIKRDGNNTTNCISLISVFTSERYRALEWLDQFIRAACTSLQVAFSLKPLRVFGL